MAVKKLISVATAGADIRIHFRGEQAMTNGREIILPAMVSPEAETLAVAYAWHESFHITWTDFDEARIREPALKARPLIKAVENALEDGRIERESRFDYPGTHGTINALIAALRDRDRSLFGEPSSDVSAPNALLGFVLNWTRYEINGYSAILYLDQWRGALKAHVGSDLVDAIEEILDHNRQLASTADAFDVATEIVDLVQPKPEEPQDGDSDEGDQGEGDQADNSDGNSESSGENSDEEADDDDSGSSGDSSDEDDSDEADGGGSGKPEDESDDSGDNPEGQDDSDGEEAGDPEGSQADASDGGQSDSDDQRQAAREAIANASEGELEQVDLGDMTSEAIDDEQQQSGNQAGSGSFNSVELPRGYTDPALYQEVAAPAGALGSRLRGVIQAETLVKNRHARRSGKRLDRRRLARVAVDDPRIFSRPDVQVDTSGHVHVLLDTSGSMNKLIPLLKRVGLATVRAIEAVDELSVSASTLPINGEVRLLKLAQENSSAVAGRFGELVDSGGTPIAQSIEAVEPLLQEPVGNRFLVIFTDGGPNNPHAVEEVISRLSEEAQVRTAAVILGEGENALEEMMPCQRIASLEELPMVVTDLVAHLVQLNVRRVA